MSWKAEQASRKRDHAADHGIVRIEARFADAITMDRAAVPPGEDAAQTIQLRKIEAERAADIAHGALRPIGDERCGKRCTIASVLAIDVLHHFLAALVLEIDVDV